MFITTSLTANQAIDFSDKANFFLLLSASSGESITIRFYKTGALISEAVNVGAGYAEKFEDSYFDRFQIVSSASTSIKAVTRLGSDVRYDTPPQGDVRLANAIDIENGGDLNTLNPATGLGISGIKNVSTPGPGGYQQAMIFNPAASGVNLFIDELSFRFDGTGSGYINMYSGTTELTNSGYGSWTNLGQAGTPQAHFSSATPGTNYAGTNKFSLPVAMPGQPKFDFSAAPILIKPGFGLVTQHYNAAASMDVLFKWREKAV